MSLRSEQTGTKELADAALVLREESELRVSLANFKGDIGGAADLCIPERS